MAIFSSRDPLGMGIPAAPRRLPVVSEEDQRRTFAAKQLAASNAASVGSRLPAAGAPAPVASNYVPPVAAPAAPISSPVPAPSGRLPISFSDAGFTSQAEYDAARSGPQTPLAGAAALAPGQASFGGDSVFGAGGLRLPVSASQQAAQASADAAAQASRLPAGVMPVASPQGWMQGANRTFTPGAKPGRGVMTKTTPEADAFVTKYGASGIPTPASQAADYAKARADNIAAAKKLPDSDPNSFSSKRAAFNQANADQHMDAEGNIVKTTKAQKDHFTTLDEADTAARAAQAKADAMKAKAVSKLAADENKAEKERQKAAEEAAKNTPAAVSQRLVKIMSYDSPGNPISPAPESPISPAPPPRRWLPILNAFSYPQR